MELMKIDGSKVLTNSWKQELIVTDSGVESEILANATRQKRSLLFTQIAQVNVSNGILASTIQIISTGGLNPVEIGGIKKQDAIKAKELIEQKIKESQSISAPTSAADEIKKYRDLLNSGAITQDEYDTKKAQLLEI